MTAKWLHKAYLCSWIAVSSAFTSLSGQTLSEWTPPVNAGAPVNTTANDV